MAQVSIEDQVIGDPTAWNFWGHCGVAMALTLANFGSAYGTAKSGMGIASMSVTRPNLAFKAIVPVIMAGILSIYGLITSILICQNVMTGVEGKAGPAPAAKALAAGLCCGISQMGAGYAIGLVGEHGVKCYGMNENIFMALILILIFSEVLGLYGMIVAIILQLG